MRLTKQQKAAIRYLMSNPDASPFEIAGAIGTSTYKDNPYSFVGRLIENGAVRLVPHGKAVFLSTDEEHPFTEDPDDDEGRCRHCGREPGRHRDLIQPEVDG